MVTPPLTTRCVLMTGILCESCVVGVAVAVVVVVVIVVVALLLVVCVAGAAPT